MSLAMIVAAVYLLGALVRLIGVISSLAGIITLKRKGKPGTFDGMRIIHCETPVPFTFFRYVFMPEGVPDAAIVRHEGAHVRQHHWVDLLMAEAASIILWFNPLMIFYRRSLKQQHEYLADRSAIAGGIDLANYLGSMRDQVERSISASLVSEFHFNSIKNRINMLTRKRTPFFVSVSYATVLPIILFGLTAFSSKDLPTERHGQIQITGDPFSLAMPIEKGNTYALESGYGKRVHPTLGVERLHTGIDLVAESGVPVVSAEGGTVVKAQFLKSWGNIIVVRHNDTYATSYSHLKSISVREGDEVRKGQVIGAVGNTGLSVKSHLHFEVLRNGKAVDPVGYLPEIRSPN
jgi:murein DD-endopeptidase MepM/ murein hydrolase activator NlpD